MNAAVGATASSSSSISTPTATPSASSFEFREGEDHLQRLAAMAQGVGKDESDTHSNSTSSLAETASLYPGYMSGVAASYAGWQAGYYQQFAQPLNPAAAAFSAWPTPCYSAPHWPSYAQSKKGRQTYQRYQTSVLESKFQQSSYVSKKQREELRLQTNLTDRQIKIWFQNRRMKAKKEKHRLEDGSDHTALLPANPPPKGLLPHSLSGLTDLNMTEDEEKVKWQLPPQGMIGHHMPPGWPTQPAYPMPYQLCPPNI